MLFRKLLAASILLFVQACATKSYPIAAPISTAAAEAMTCRELELELLDMDGVAAKIADTQRHDWRTVAAYTMDFGIGNVMARSDAERAFYERKSSIQVAMESKGCDMTGMPIVHRARD